MKSGFSIVQSLLAVVMSVLSSQLFYICGHIAIKLTMLAIAIVWKLVPRVSDIIVNLVASFPEYVLQLGDVTSITHGQTDRHYPL